MTFSLCDRIVSTEWKDLVPRQRISDCRLLHIPRWGHCDQPLSSHQTFLPDVELRASASAARRPLSFWFASRHCDLGLSGSEYKYCASLISLPLSQDVLDLSSENCVRKQAILCPLDYLRTPPAIQEDLANGRPHLDCHPSFSFSFGFLMDRTWCHFVTSL